MGEAAAKNTDRRALGDEGGERTVKVAGGGRGGPADHAAVLLEQERAAVRARRKAFGFAEGDGRTVGLALSGGGIRSATFSLGVLQALSKAKLLPRIDYLSTVSGGSYIGSFFGALYVDRSGRTPDPESQKKFAFDPLGSDRGRKAIANLREFGRYLTPGGFSDTMFGVSLVLRNWLTLQLVLGLVPLLFFLAERLVWKHVDPSRWWMGDVLFRPGSGPEQSGAWFSWVFMGLTGVAAAMASGCAIAYWFSRRSNVPPFPLRRLVLNAPFFATLIAFLLLLLPLARGLGFTDWAGRYLPLSLAAPVLAVAASPASSLILFAEAALAIAIGAYLFTAFADWTAHKAHLRTTTAAAEAEERIRGKLTRYLSTWIFVLLILLGLTVVQALGRELFEAADNAVKSWGQVDDRIERSEIWAAVRVAVRNFWPAIAIMAPAALTIWGHVTLRRGSGTGWLSRPAGQTMLGMSILFLWLIVWAAIAVAMSGDGLLWYAVALLVLTLLVGVSYGFLNLSSLATLYSARLKRAYIGASQTETAKAGYDVDRSGDHIPMPRYYGGHSGATDEAGPLERYRPLHLINVTLAQTQPEGNSHVVAYDRKGKPLQASFGGVIYQGANVRELRGLPYPSEEDVEAGTNTVEPLPLSYWIALSGAAASTALGSLTSIGLSVLAMMANVRLGYWWQVRRGAPWPLVPGYLFKELTASFSADAKSKRWYLTDGGHFENTGAYALLQRGVDFIVVCDNGADPDYRLDDMVRLIDRARIDFGAQITFLSARELDAQFGIDDEAKGNHAHLRHAFGSYEQLASKPDPSRINPPAPYAALARIEYERAPPGVADFAPKEGLLLLIKPRINFTEPPELLAYRQRDAGRDFPQQTTLDQFFDEEQWEAYRRFGQVVGDRIFGEDGKDTPAGVMKAIVASPGDAGPEPATGKERTRG